MNDPLFRQFLIEYENTLTEPEPAPKNKPVAVHSNPPQVDLTAFPDLAIGSVINELLSIAGATTLPRRGPDPSLVPRAIVPVLAVVLGPEVRPEQDHQELLAMVRDLVADAIQPTLGGAGRKGLPVTAGYTGPDRRRKK